VPGCRLRSHRALGAGQRERADALVFHAFLLALALVRSFATLMLLGGPFLFRSMGGRDDMLAAALSYANVAMGGAVCICMLNLLAMRCAAPATWRCRRPSWSPACWSTSPYRRC